MTSTTIAESKTPISSLQELCTKWGIVPKYDLVSHSGLVHDPIFEYSVTVGEQSAAGKGTSKKRAKHRAAEALLSQVNGSAHALILENSAVKPVRSQDGEISDAVSSSQDGNPIGRLQELTQKRRWPPPIYECTNEGGLAHSREYMITVHLLRLTERGVGPSKKLAKKRAATAMLQQVENCDSLLQTYDTSGSSADSSILCDQELIQSLQDLKLGNKKLDTLNPQTSQKINMFYTALKSKMGKTLASLQGLSLNVPATNYCQMLQEIAEEQSFTATYVDLAELTTDEKYQCLVQLSSLPVAVCHGTGRTIDDAHLLAAHCALQYLKIMTRKT